MSIDEVVSVNFQTIYNVIKIVNTKIRKQRLLFFLHVPLLYFTELHFVRNCHEFERFCQKVKKISGIFCDMFSGDIPCFVSLFNMKKELNVK